MTASVCPRTVPLKNMFQRGNGVSAFPAYWSPGSSAGKKGDRVFLAGQKIAQAGGFVSAAIHASVSGVVKGIEKRLTATGSMVDSILLENDGLYEQVEFIPAALEELSRKIS